MKPMLRRVKTENGWVKGIPAADPRITAFKGIPFAAPPVGENRWRAPQPAADWEGDRLCYTFAPISVQDTPGVGDGLYDREWHVDPEIPMSEDCLYLNVWTPAHTADEKLPVLVWYFGGGLQWGYPSEMEFDGERCARRGIIVVSVNYRINVFGFLAHPELTAAQPDAPTNFGSLDQQAGLRWVKRNIAAFGGDPDNITIAGQSAGGGSVLSQMTCPANFGLFKRAIVQSAMIRSPYTDSNGIRHPSGLEAAEKNGEKLFEVMGVKTLAEARALDAKFVLQKYNEFAQTNPRFFSIQDDRFCIGDPMELFVRGQHADVDVLAGNTQDEFLSFIHAESDEEYRAEVERIFKGDADKFMAQPEAQTKDGRGNRAFVNGIECTCKALFERDVENGSDKKHYHYIFDVPMPGDDNPGSFHSSELWFFFETLAKCHRPFTGKYYDLARHMCNYYVNFIKCGDPNGKDIDGSDMPEWKSYTTENDAFVRFTPDGVVNTDETGEFKRILIDHIKETLK